MVGSVIANVCLALTIAALIAPVRVSSGTVRREAPLSVVSVAAFAALALGGISVAKGTVMAVALVPVVAILVASARRPGRDTLRTEVVEFLEKPARKARPEVLRAMASLVVMLGAAELMVNCVVGQQFPVRPLDLDLGYGLRRSSIDTHVSMQNIDGVLRQKAGLPPERVIESHPEPSARIGGRRPTSHGSRVVLTVTHSSVGLTGDEEPEDYV